jgi:hypothetical protein
MLTKLTMVSALAIGLTGLGAAGASALPSGPLDLRDASASAAETVQYRRDFYDEDRGDWRRRRWERERWERERWRREQWRREQWRRERGGW